MNRKVDIDRCRFQRFMTHQGFDRQEIGSVFIKVGSESMAEGMAGKAFRPAKILFVRSDMTGKEEGIDWPGRIRLFREKPACRPAAFKPVLGEDAKGIF